MDKTVTSVSEGLAVCHEQLSNAAVDGAALVNGSMQQPEAVRPSDPLPDAVHAAVDQVVMCNMMTPGSSSNAETAFPPKEAFLSNRQSLKKRVSEFWGGWTSKQLVRLAQWPICAEGQQQSREESQAEGGEGQNCSFG